MKENLKMAHKKVLLSIPEKMLVTLDANAEEDGRSRSEYIREAIRYYFLSFPPVQKQSIEDLGI